MLQLNVPASGRQEFRSNFRSGEVEHDPKDTGEPFLRPWSICASRLPIAQRDLAEIGHKQINRETSWWGSARAGGTGASRDSMQDRPTPTPADRCLGGGTRTTHRPKRPVFLLDPYFSPPSGHDP